MKWLWRSFIFLFLALSIFIIFLLTPAGLKTGLSIAKTFLPGELKYASASGLLTGPIELKNIDYRQKNLEVRIQSLHFNWSLWALFFKRLSLQDLKASHIQIIQHRPPEKPSSSFDFSLLLHKNLFLEY